MTDWVQKQMARIRGEQAKDAQKGGPGSGHHGHAGRPGKRGGSQPGKGGGRSASGCRPFKNLEQADAWGKQHNQVVPAETEEQLTALQVYKGDNSDEINEWLRGGERGDLAPELEQSVYELDGLMAPTDRDIVAYRGLPQWSMDAYYEGDQFTDAGFVSTSLNQEFADNLYGRGTTLVEIRIPKGTYGRYLPAPDDPLLRGEYEFLLERGAKFRVVSRDDIRDTSSGPPFFKDLRTNFVIEMVPGG